MQLREIPPVHLLKPSIAEKVGLLETVDSNQFKTPDDLDKTKETWEQFVRQVKIRSGRKIIPFDPYPYQSLLIEQIEKHFTTIAIKSRQMGFSEVSASYLLWRAIDDPGFMGLVFSKTQEDSSDLARRVRLMALSHPRIELETENLKDLKLVNGGRITFKPATATSSRGANSVSCVLFDEAAFVPDIEEIYAATLPATEMLGEDARIIILSTPNGRSGFYWDRVSEGNGDRDIIQVCKQVREGEIEPVQYWTDEGGWAKFLVHFRAHPIYSKRPNYLEEIKKRQKITDAQLQREYNLSFDDGVASVFKHELVDRAARGQFKRVQWFRKYIAGIDPSFGGDDFFTVQIWDVTESPYELVAEYREQRKGKDYNIVNTIELLDLYKPVMISVEANGGGSLIMEDLIKKRSLFRFEAVQTTNASKIVNTDRLVLMLERDMLTFAPDSALASEMRTFTETVTGGGGRIRSAPNGKHDDAVMAAAIAFANIDAIELQSTETVKNFLSVMS